MPSSCTIRAPLGQHNCHLPRTLSKIATLH
jgi:hypothetical protein